MMAEGLPPQNRCDALGDEDQLVVFVGFPKPIGCRPGQIAKAGFTIAQLLFRLLQLGQILDQGHVMAAIFRSHRAERNNRRENLVVHAFGDDLLASGQRPLRQGFKTLAIHGQRLPTAARHFALAIAKNFLGPAIELLDPTGKIDDNDGLAQIRHQIGEAGVSTTMAIAKDLLIAGADKLQQAIKIDLPCRPSRLGELLSEDWMHGISLASFIAESIRLHPIIDRPCCGISKKYNE